MTGYLHQDDSDDILSFFDEADQTVEESAQPTGGAVEEGADPTLKLEAVNPTDPADLVDQDNVPEEDVQSFLDDLQIDAPPAAAPEPGTPGPEASGESAEPEKSAVDDELTCSECGFHAGDVSELFQHIKSHTADAATIESQPMADSAPNVETGGDEGAMPVAAPDEVSDALDAVFGEDADGSGDEGEAPKAGDTGAVLDAFAEIPEEKKEEVKVEDPPEKPKEESKKEAPPEPTEADESDDLGAFDADEILSLFDEVETGGSFRPKTADDDAPPMPAELLASLKLEMVHKKIEVLELFNADTGPMKAQLSFIEHSAKEGNQEAAERAATELKLLTKVMSEEIERTVSNILGKGTPDDVRAKFRGLLEIALRHPNIRNSLGMVIAEEASALMERRFTEFTRSNLFKEQIERATGDKIFDSPAFKDKLDERISEIFVFLKEKLVPRIVAKLEKKE